MNLKKLLCITLTSLCLSMNPILSFAKNEVSTKIGSDLGSVTITLSDQKCDLPQVIAATNPEFAKQLQRGTATFSEKGQKDKTYKLCWVLIKAPLVPVPSIVVMDEELDVSYPTIPVTEFKPSKQSEDFLKKLI